MTDVAVRDEQQQITIGGNELDRAARLGMWLAAAESGSKDPKALGMAAALRIAYANSLNLPAHAASEVYVIKGNLTLSAKLLRALAHQHGLRVVRVSETSDSCTAAVIDAKGNELGRTTFTLAMATQMGIDKPSSTGKPSNWKVVPERMLWARASKRALDDHAPWVTVGVMSYEEAIEAAPGEPVPFESDELIDDSDVEIVDGDGSLFPIPESAR